MDAMKELLCLAVSDTGALLVGLALLLPLAALLALFALLVWAVKKIFSFMPIWIEARAASIPIGFADCFEMHFQKLNPREIFDALKMLHKAGIEVTCDELQNHVLSGGHLKNVRDAAIAVDKAGLRIGFPQIAQLDLAGRDVALAVRDHVNPVVLRVPPPLPGYENGLVGVAKDGISLGVKARVTVRTRLDNLIGTAGDLTIVARVGEGIVTAIGRAASHREIMEQPGRVAQEIISRGLDRGTCYEILSLDIEDVNVLDNVAARLRTVRADADKRIAQARSEERRALAVAQGQEMKAKTVSAQAEVLASMTELPRSEAAAFSGARIGNRKPLPATDIRM